MFIYPNLCPISSGWFGLIFLRTGFYAGAVFRFHIVIGKDFPHTKIPVNIAKFLLKASNNFCFSADSNNHVHTSNFPP